jgi:2-desacetyl-2-hydroxyethyl bacteriochlorophyllide A dehydrogenase
MITAKAILVTGVGVVAVGEAKVPEPGPGEVLVKAAYTCVSPGTELRCLAGKEQGSDQHPFVPGYSLTGVVEAVGDGVTLPIGTPVYCAGTGKCETRRQWGGHISHAVLAANGAFPLPDGVDLKQASLAALAAIAYHGVRLSRPQPHESVAVVGLGPIGQLSARLHAATGARTVGVDLAPGRVRALREVGVEAVEAGADMNAAVRALLPDGADVVVDCTGSPAVTAKAIELARELGWAEPFPTGPRFVVQGSYPDSFTLPYRGVFQREMTILVPRNRDATDTRTVLRLMATGQLRAVDLITETYRPEDAPEAYARLKDPNGGLLTMAFDWR